jgi:hypothetical protein
MPRCETLTVSTTIYLSISARPIKGETFKKNQADGREEHQPGEGERAK